MLAGIKFGKKEDKAAEEKVKTKPLARAGCRFNLVPPGRRRRRRSGRNRRAAWQNLVAISRPRKESWRLSGERRSLFLSLYPVWVSFIAFLPRTRRRRRLVMRRRKGSGKLSNLVLGSFRGVQ